MHKPATKPKCKRCREPAVVQLPAHHSAFCRDCFFVFFERQVERAITEERMVRSDEEVLVAVSGGKDSLALWDVLDRLGYRTVGLHLDLGIGGYSRLSREKTEQFARQRQLRLEVVEFEEYGHAVPEMVRFTRRAPCAACGTAKRYYFDRIAAERGFSVVATGHNLDDEAARLLGNVLRWDVDHLARQRPVLEPSHERFARKVKPLFRLSEYETAAYAFLRRLDYVIEECPNAAGATQLRLKEHWNRIEADMPGSKLHFVLEFYRRAQPRFVGAKAEPPGTCERCGMPAHRSLCSFCSLVLEVERRKAPTSAAAG